ncbi:MAG: P-II family nitrogen regulator [Fidelibacterota bacterium]
MKYVQAYIKPYKLSAVTLALHEVNGLTGMSVTELKGFGRGRAKDAPHRIQDELVDFVPNVKVEIFCRDGLVEQVVSTIREAAHTGLQGDGKIYVIPATQAYRIRTGEEGDAAV